MDGVLSCEKSRNKQLFGLSKKENESRSSCRQYLCGAIAKLVPRPGNLLERKKQEHETVVRVHEKKRQNEQKGDKRFEAEGGAGVLQ